MPPNKKSAMLEHIGIERFRVFKSLDMACSYRINIVTGENNAGKTTLLEALYLQYTVARLPVGINSDIVRQPFSDSPNAARIGANYYPRNRSSNPFRNQLFHNFDASRYSEITAHHQQHGMMNVRISFYRHSSQLQLPFSDEEELLYLDDIRRLVFFSDGFIHRESPDAEEPSGAYTFTGLNRLLKEQIAAVTAVGDAVRLSELRRQKQDAMLRNALRIIEPRLQSVEDNSSSGSPLIVGDVGLSELMPLSVMGEGMTRITRILLAIANAANGIALIEEIENGIHYSVLPKLWPVIENAARAYNTQVFATTHSIECIQAAYTSLKPDAYRLHRLQVEGDENICTTYTPEALAGTIEFNLDPR